MSNFKQETIKIYETKKELHRKIDCVHNILFSGETIPFIAFPFISTYLFDILIELFRISNWISQNKRKILACKDKETIVLIRNILSPEDTIVKRINNYIDILNQKASKSKSHDAYPQDINDALKFLFLNLENWESSPHIKENNILLKHLQAEYSTDENNIYVLLQLKKEQLLNPKQR